MNVGRARERSSPPRPRSAPTLDWTCDAQRCASSLERISFARASAREMAEVAVEKIPPHHPPPELWAWLSATAASARKVVSFWGKLSGSAELSVLGVKLLWKERALSTDFRGRARSSELRAASLEGGVAVLLRLGEDRRAGVVVDEETFGV